MFLNTFRNIVRVSNNCHQFSHRLCNTAAKPNPSHPFTYFGIHNVRLTGKVMKIFDKNTNGIVFYINSLSNGHFRKTHKIVVSNRNGVIHELARNKLALNQSVLIEGKLSTIRLEVDGGKHRSSTAIIATELCIFSDVAAVSDSGNDSEAQNDEPNDENSVELLGTVNTDLIGNDFKSFTLASIINPNRSGRDANNKSFNRIFVYDKTLFPVLDGLEVKRDEVLVRGDISYRSIKDDNGKTTSSSYIRANQIYRIC